jgi:hypothetical protein
MPFATGLMLAVDRDGLAVVGTFERAEAERMAGTATTSAREKGFPLRITVEAANRTDAARSVSRWLRRRMRPTHVRLSVEQMPAAERATAAPSSLSADFGEALACPLCGNPSMRYRKVDDALVCSTCAGDHSCDRELQAGPRRPDRRPRTIRVLTVARTSDV